MYTVYTNRKTGEVDDDTAPTRFPRTRGLEFFGPTARASSPLRPPPGLTTYATVPGRTVPRLWVGLTRGVLVAQSSWHLHLSTIFDNMTYPRNKSGEAA